MTAEQTSETKQRKIVVVDDNPDIRKMIAMWTNRKGYQTVCMERASEALTYLAGEKADVLVTDIHLHKTDGIELARIVCRQYDTDVIIMTGDSENYTYDDIIETGASDFMLKPFSMVELMGRLRRVLRERALIAGQRKMNARLKAANEKARLYAEELADTLDSLERVHAELKDSYLDSVNRLARAAEYKDEMTGDHILRMSEFCGLLAVKAGLGDAGSQIIRYAAPMHDVGKIGIADHILLKPGKLTKEEFDIIKTHTTIGAAILSASKSEILQTAHDIALNHHEKWNGGGYPRGLSGEQIPLPAAIVAIADVFDALTSKRPYKDPYPLDVTLDIIRSERGAHFSPFVTDLFFSNIDTLIDIKNKNTIEAFHTGPFRFSKRDLAGKMVIITGMGEARTYGM